ncbi:porin [Fulvivirga sedimenti]|uniref:OprO/OprP family phosphate-selective porin n=1 Tax=Fulvivirga sedimenti TaxID=2879465 RepID=A0A9X1HLF1_9BACT|nr:porin [Fulvivirga sedimenti]MCA6074061.1 OprO/OprP family phosphate-selective porin [Fulvivirga sedimenti]
MKISNLNAQDKADTLKKIDIEYTSKGFQFKTKDNKYKLQIQSRLQFRFSTPGDQDPVDFDDFNRDPQTTFKINRARLKIGGNAFEPWLGYYFEYELAQNNLLDFRIMIEKWSFFKIKVGQWKIDYSRERSISSGQQQMVDRSIVNRPFTLDRQQGIAFYGRLNEGKISDFNYWISILTGNGRGTVNNDDKHLMYAGRIQWNFLGRELGYTNSDLNRRSKPVGLVALAGATNISQYTRFSSSGGGSLEGYEDGIPGQYEVNQWMFETAFMYRGFSWSQEFHHKYIEDRINGGNNSLIGNYVMIGYFLNPLIHFIPKGTEVAFRHAFYDPNTSLEQVRGHEFGFAINHFFNEHRNKLTMEFTRFIYDDNSSDNPEDFRFRIQWDISL